MKRFSLFLASLLFVSSCTAQVVNPNLPPAPVTPAPAVVQPITPINGGTINFANVHNDTYIVCVNKLDKSQLKFLKSQQHNVPSTLFPDITLSQITDITAHKWLINSLEWQNYTCVNNIIK